MKKIVFLLIISFSVSGQIKGIVKDSISGKPISYVNIWVENENIGITADENGNFSIGLSEKNKNLIFSALGFEKKTMKGSMATIVNLKPTSYQLNEVVISKMFETKKIEIGKTTAEIFQAFDNGPRIDVKFFPYLPSYKKTKFIKQVVIFTDSRIESATVKLHFYANDVNGYPGEELLDKDCIVTVKKGVIKRSLDLTEFNLRMPKNGVFVGFEKLVIEKNKTEKTVTDFNKNTTTIIKMYFPFVLYNYVERPFLFTFSGGKWSKQTDGYTANSSVKMMVYEPAINLILTN